MKNNGKRTQTICLAVALVVLAAFSTVTVMGAALPTPLQQDATATPAGEAEVTTTPVEEEPATATPMPEEEMTATPAEEDRATATPMEEAEEETAATTTPATAEEMTATPAEEAEATTNATPEPLSDDALISMGEEVYASYCAACHQLDGQGIENAYPALAGNAFVLAEDPAGVLRVVFTGRAGMPHFRDYLSKQAIAAVVSYIRNGWENDASVVTLEEVQTVRQEIYSPSEEMEHTGESERESSSAPDKDEQEGENSQE